MDPQLNKKIHSKLRGVNPSLISFEDGNWYLNLAANVGDIELASKLLTKQKADVNFCHDGYSVLHVAVNRKDIAMVRLLIAHKVNPNPANTNRTMISPLWTATVQDYNEIAELLIGAGANVNERMTPFDVSFLHMAAASGDRRRINLLIDYGADINSKNTQGKSVLQYALIDSGYETVELLLSRGADVNATDNEGASVLHQAASNGDKSMVLLLLRYGADVKKRDNQGSNALHYATSFTANNIEVIEILLRSGTPINGVNLRNLTPLHCAIAAEKYEMVDLLIRYGADLQAKSKATGISPLIISVQMDSIPLTKLLLDSGAFVNDRTLGKKTALHQACILGNSAMVRLLLDYDADVNVVNKRGKTPLSNVQMSDDNNVIASMLIKKIAMLEDKTNEVNLSVIDSDTRLRKLYDEYHSEIEKMKRMKLGDKLGFTYYYIFAGEIEKIVKLARNKEFVKKFESREYFVDFPYYAQVMEEKFKKAKRVTEKIIEREEMLYKALGDHLTLPIIQNVAQLMTDED